MFIETCSAWLINHIYRDFWSITWTNDIWVDISYSRGLRYFKKIGINIYEFRIILKENPGCICIPQIGKYQIQIFLFWAKKWQKCGSKYVYFEISKFYYNSSFSNPHKNVHPGRSPVPELIRRTQQAGVTLQAGPTPLSRRGRVQRHTHLQQ